MMRQPDILFSLSLFLCGHPIDKMYPVTENEQDDTIPNFTSSEEETLFWEKKFKHSCELAILYLILKAPDAKTDSDREQLDLCMQDMKLKSALVKKYPRIFLDSFKQHCLPVFSREEWLAAGVNPQIPLLNFPGPKN